MFFFIFFDILKCYIISFKEKFDWKFLKVKLGKYFYIMFKIEYKIMIKGWVYW